MATTDYEKLGLFYLGRQVDADTKAMRPEPYLLDSRHLVTHGVILGMTGSGKTGLAVSLLEEAALDNIPALVIDPKGDLSNLLLTFPQLAAGDFLPYVDAEEATRAGATREALAEQTAARWKAGLADWQQTGERIARFRDAANVTVYTPGSSAGVRLALLRPLVAPPPELRADRERLHERIGTSIAALLGLLGVDADPLRSREHILLSAIVEAEWTAGRDLDLGRLIPLVQQPPITKIGVLDLDSFFPSKDRNALALQLNALFASPLYQTWSEGEPLEISRLLFSEGGKPRLAVLSIAHLSEEQRQFFVATFLGEVVAWMRQQSGTSSLRALLYMDEIFGYFPPSANPPSKQAMLLLLKQARAYGLGVVLATQNPVDLDYKALGNAGIWMVGRLQQERDRLRLLDGLEGAATTTGRAFDRAALARQLASLESRVFLVHDVHAADDLLIRTRWTLSYLRGPLPRELLQRAQKPQALESTTQKIEKPSPAPASSTARPPVPAEIKQVFIRQRGEDKEVVRPFVLARVALHFADKKLGVDAWQKRSLVTAVGAGVVACNWDEAAELGADHELEGKVPDGVQFAEVAGVALQPANYPRWEKAAKQHAYAMRKLALFAAGGLVSKPGESETDFRARLQLALREGRDAELAAVQKKYGAKVTAIAQKIEDAQSKLIREQAEARTETMDTAMSVGAGILGALLGRKVASAANVNRARAAAKSAARTSRQREDAAAAERKLTALRAQQAELQAEVDQALKAIEASVNPQTLTLETVELAPKKADITVEGIYLAWG